MHRPVLQTDGDAKHDCEARQLPKMDATQAFRATAENSFAKAKEAFEKVSAATPEATVLIKNSTVKGLGAWS